MECRWEVSKCCVAQQPALRVCAALLTQLLVLCVRDLNPVLLRNSMW